MVGLHIGAFEPAGATRTLELPLEPEIFTLVRPAMLQPYLPDKRRPPARHLAEATSQEGPETGF